ncbi:MAG: NRDE family protein [Myxococcales bacterium]
MCTLLLAHRIFPGAPLVVAANRDEMLARASAPPALVQGEPRALMPKDLVAGGSWLGLNERGLFVGITNRAGQPPDKSRKSRGALVVEALKAPDAATLHERLAGLDAHRYNPFHLLYSDGAKAFVTWCDGAKVRQQTLEMGLHVITERSMGGDDRGRTERLRRLFEEKLARKPPELEPFKALLTLHGPEGDPLGGSCVHADVMGYGTRSGFVYLGGNTPRAWWMEGHPCEAKAHDLRGMVEELYAGKVPNPG